MARRRGRRRRRFNMPEISLTPLIDTALTLLLIFMVTAPVVHNGIKVALPQGQTKEASEQQELVVSMNSEGVLYLGNEEVERKQLMVTLQKTLEGHSDQPVFVRADEKLSYGTIIGLVDELKQAGVQLVALSTQPSQSN